jgi:alpha/beta superfamily hydrolase
MITTSIKLKKEKTKLIKGPIGKLEVALAKPTEKSHTAWAIVCHPHPLHGGTMTNKVVTTLAKTFQGLGLNTVRFNFRGVGKSEGEYDEGTGELNDLLAVVDWVREVSGQKEVWLAGFSFGAYIAAMATPIIDAKCLVTVAPPVEHFPLDTLPPILCPWVLVQGERDDVVPPKLVFEWAKSRQPKPAILRFPEAGHFFHGQLSELRARITDELIK